MSSRSTRALCTRRSIVSSIKAGLRQSGAVSELGRRAKYYRLTPSGRRQLTVEAGEWERMSAAIERVMKLA